MDYSQHAALEFRRKFWRLFGASISVIDPVGNLPVGFIEMKAWKLREDVRLYSYATKQQELLRIHSRRIIDFGATYDIYDSASDQLLFSLRRKGLKSTFVRDHWYVYDSNEQVIADLQETSGVLALVRRYIGFIPFVGFVADIVLMVSPLTYSIRTIVNGNASTIEGLITHRKNPFIVKMGLDMSAADPDFDRRIGVALTALLSVIDASKN